MIESTRRRTSQPIIPLWLGIVIGVLAVLNGLPFLAPAFMKLGWENAGRLVYMLYAPLCHQMAQRSFFMFGPGGFEMHNLADLPLNMTNLSMTEQTIVLRRFVGSEALGWKVAWSDRMVSMYVAPLLVALGYAVVRRRREIAPLPLWAFVLLLLPMAVDGGTHWLSDLSGIGQGFRYTNEWLAALTRHALPANFYLGDAIGSFNWWMRLISGLSFGLGIGGVLYPHLDATWRQSRQLNEKRSVLKQELLARSDANS